MTLEDIPPEQLIIILDQLIHLTYVIAFIVTVGAVGRTLTSAINFRSKKYLAVKFKVEEKNEEEKPKLIESIKEWWKSRKNKDENEQLKYGID